MRKRLLLDILGVLLGSMAILLIVGQFGDMHRWHVGAWNDQVGYVSVARGVVETGELRSNVIYTSTLRQKADRNYLYMPGHYFALALSFATLGVGPLQSVIPSLLSYFVATCCVFLTGRRLYGRQAAFLGAGLFALSPAVVAFSFTAMAELTLLAAISLAICVFVHLPPKLRPWGGPLLLSLPFVFRETTALLVIPMAGLILGGIPLRQQIEWRRWRAVSVFCLLSVGALVYIYMSPLSAGRPSLTKVNVFDLGEKGIYQDATAADKVPTSPTAWAKAIGSNVLKNIRRLPETRYSLPSWHEPIGLAALLIGIVLSLTFGWVRRDGIAFGAGIMGVALLAFLFGMYNVRDYRGLRTLLFALPLLTMPAGAWLSVWWARAAEKNPTHLVIAIATFTAITIAMACSAVAQNLAYDMIDDQATAVVATVDHDPRQLLACPYNIGLPYIASHYPVKWAFLPENPRTLVTLMKKYDVGTLIVARGSTSLRGIQLIKAGFAFDRYIMWQNELMAVYKKKRPGLRAQTQPVSLLVKRRAFVEVGCWPVRVGIYLGRGGPDVRAAWWGRDPAPLDPVHPRYRSNTQPTTSPTLSEYGTPSAKPAEDGESDHRELQSENRGGRLISWILQASQR